MTDFQCLCCGQCCGPAPCSKTEWKAIVAYIRKHNIMPIHREPESLTCFLRDEDNRCMVYPVRPAICRLHGRIRAMPCPNNLDCPPIPHKRIAGLHRQLPPVKEAVWLVDEEAFQQARIPMRMIVPFAS